MGSTKTENESNTLRARSIDPIPEQEYAEWWLKRYVWHVSKLQGWLKYV